VLSPFVEQLQRRGCEECDQTSHAPGLVDLPSSSANTARPPPTSTPSFAPPPSLPPPPPDARAAHHLVPSPASPPSSPLSSAVPGGSPPSVRWRATASRASRSSAQPAAHASPKSLRHSPMPPRGTSHPPHTLHRACMPPRLRLGEALACPSRLALSPPLLRPP